MEGGAPPAGILLLGVLTLDLQEGGSPQIRSASYHYDMGVHMTSWHVRASARKKSQQSAFTRAERLVLRP